MRFICIIGNVDGSGEPWNEDYDKPQIADLEQAHKWAAGVIARFNDSLRPGEKARKLIDVIASAEASSSHSWQKVNAFTLEGRGRLFDVMRCSRCQITGKRYGINGSVVRDASFKSPGFASCSRSIEILAARKKE